MEFSIVSIVARDHDSSFGGYPYRVDVVVTMDAKVWAKCKKAGSLGQLYGIDISNAVYRLNRAVDAMNPTVGDKSRASNGVKTIELTYYGRSFEKAECLGLKVTWLKNGTAFVGYGSHSVLYSRPKQSLKLVEEGVA